MTNNPLPQRVARAVGEGGVVFFAGMHLTLKEWLGRK